MGCVSVPGVRMVERDFGVWLYLAEAEELSEHVTAVAVICCLFAEHQFGGISAKQQMPLSNYLETASVLPPPSRASLQRSEESVCDGLCSLMASLARSGMACSLGQPRPTFPFSQATGQRKLLKRNSKRHQCILKLENV